jgi:hypothetical protein
MSGLQQMVDRRRADEAVAAHPCYSTKAQSAAVLVEAAGGENWVLPWQHFIFGRHRDDGDREQLVLTFVAHEVTLRGMNLAVIAEEAANLRLESVRAAPGKYLKSAGAEPFIERVDVQTISERIDTS